MSRQAVLGTALGVVAVLVLGVGAATMAFDGDDDDPSPSSTTAPAGSTLDVALVGDSFAEQSRDAFLAGAEQLGLTASADAFGGSALCDWISLGRIGELAQARPGKLVLSFAGNDVTGCINPTCDPAIGLSSCQNRPPDLVAQQYREELDDVFEMFEGSGTEMYVVLPPPIMDEQYERRAAAMRAMYQAALADHPELQLIDSATQLDPDGVGYQPTLPCLPSDGADCGPDGRVVVREDRDKIHLTPAGGRRYAQAILDAIAAP